MLALRYVYVLALVVWLGGMLILGALVAPTTFQVLEQIMPSTGRALAGHVFGTMIARFHYVAYAAGAVLLLTLATMAVLGPRPPSFAIRCVIIVIMLAVAGYSGFVVLRSIDAIQLAQIFDLTAGSLRQTSELGKRCFHGTDQVGFHVHKAIAHRFVDAS